MTFFEKADPGNGQLKEDSTGEHFPLGGLLLLSTAIFISMSTEFLPGGLIPQIAETFQRPPSDAGNLITVFALTVILTAAPLAAVTRRIPRKALVLVSFAAIGAANAATALSTTFEMLLAARILGAVAHGAFWSVVAAYPASLVRSSQLGKATAVTAAGGSVAGVLGIPLGNALGQMFGWRVSFAALVGLTLLVFLLMVRFLPPITSFVPRQEADDAGKPTPDATLPAVLMICFLILFVVAAQNAFGTYGVVWLLDVVKVAPEAVPIVLLAGGIASAGGVALTGAYYGRAPIRLFVGALALMVGILFSLPAAAESGYQAVVWILLILMGAVFGGIPIMLQTRMMWTASPRARSIAAALQTTAFNVGIGSGAFMGGVVLERSTAEALPFFAAILMFMAFLTAMGWEVKRQRNSRRGKLVS
ncbi:MFS transporter [Arthrobacter rhizosphaerae]|uniref:MFS transporter n=1 Tax=Arthrobacter rhizosphaerae TaxID=2855490 RepID=UPI001FF3321C|nr:MFS transporter [Arthrobacter rhizosphaerae]